MQKCIATLYISFDKTIIVVRIFHIVKILLSGKTLKHIAQRVQGKQGLMNQMP